MVDLPVDVRRAVAGLEAVCLARSIPADKARGLISELVFEVTRRIERLAPLTPRAALEAREACVPNSEAWHDADLRLAEAIMGV